MASRYKKSNIINNDMEFYEFLRKKRGNVKAIQHLPTPIMKHPSASERATLSRTKYIWKYGDRFYNLADKYYGDSRYWWVIAWWNSYPTEATVQIGTVLSIPLKLEEALNILGV